MGSSSTVFTGSMGSKVRLNGLGEADGNSDLIAKVDGRLVGSEQSEVTDAKDDVSGTRGSEVVVEEEDNEEENEKDDTSALGWGRIKAPEAVFVPFTARGLQSSSSRSWKG